jgi:protein TonB
MTAPAKIKDVRPNYPPKARAAGIFGVVILELALDIDGHVLDAKVLRSIKALDQAAVDAAMQWRFTPLIVNGRPKPTVITVTVAFPRDGVRPKPTTAGGQRTKIASQRFTLGVGSATVAS